MRHCQHCDIEFTNPRCPRCGRPPSGTLRDPAQTSPPSPAPLPDLSDPEGTLDAMVQAASRPSLASLVKAGIKRGLIQPVADYATRKTSK